MSNLYTVYFVGSGGERISSQVKASGFDSAYSKARINLALNPSTPTYSAFKHIINPNGFTKLWDTQVYT